MYFSRQLWGRILPKAILIVQGISISGNALQNNDYGYNYKTVLALSPY
jgi:hypothetical protein